MNFKYHLDPDYLVTISLTVYAFSEDAFCSVIYRCYIIHYQKLNEIINYFSKQDHAINYAENHETIFKFTFLN